MFYPINWDKTPITIQRNNIGYDGVTETTTLTTNVRMSFKKYFTKDANGNIIQGNGTFYKYGDLAVNFGDNFQVDGIEYTCNSVYKPRLASGDIEYTRVGF